MQLPKIKKPTYDQIVNNVIASSKMECIYINEKDIAKIKAQVAQKLKINYQ